ncbi:MAG: DnaD domain protein [Anaerolineales bacterium]|nr:DnaD domain protein [Anaerolineales bacterium]MCS7247901.1 DnaD domain protein [Anaerolineales bacterium]MDW8161711.1 DnaD domain protein [Anaerolineales bacterium]MDW8447217.1 DnaD domain protein [Anaerolineales bacterium]
MSALRVFSGFSEGARHTVPLPTEFFRDLLAEVDDLNELKVILYTFWFLHRQGGAVRYIRAVDYQRDAAFMAGLLCEGSHPQRALSRALQRAVERGVLLRGLVRSGEDEVELFFLNTSVGRAALQAIQEGRWRFTESRDYPVEVEEELPNIYRLYEQHIAPLTPMIAERLREAEETYPPQWIEEAIRIAVENNARSWRYVEAILRRWKEEGKGERKAGADPQEALRKYSEQWRKPSGKTR